MHQVVNFAQKTLGVKLYPGQAEALSNYYESGAQNWLLLAGRRSGKSLISDIVACYEALVPDFAGIVRPGEDRYILVIATRLDGARLHIRNIAKLLKHTRAFGSMIEKQTEDSLELKNGVVILALPCSARSGRGYTASTLIFDELAHFVDSMGNSSADGVFDALAPTVATFGEAGRMVITTTPASRTGIVFDLYDRAQAGELPEFHVTRADTRTLNPKVSERTILSAYKRDPESAAVEYGAEFRDPVEAFFNGAALDAVIDPGLQQAEKAQDGVSYLMAIDPALMKDRYGLAIAHELDGVMVLDYVKAIRPPVDPNAAEDLLFSLAERFNPTRIYCDQASTTERLKGRLPALEYTPFTRPLKLRIYGALKEAINLSKIVLPDDKDLVDELKSLQIRNGVDIAAPRSGKITHDDLADCVALLADALVSEQNTSTTYTADPFAVWPPAPGETFSNVFGWGNYRTAPHPPGITWQNCPHRNQGCEACATEWENSDYRKAERAMLNDPNFTPMGEQEFKQIRLQGLYRPVDPRQTAARQTVRTIFDNIRANLRKENGKNV